MDIKKININNRYSELYIIDNLFTASEIFGIFKEASDASYAKKNYDTTIDSILPVHNKWRCNLNIDELMNIELLPNKIQKIFSQILHQSEATIDIIASYINYSDCFTVDKLHVDKYNEYVHSPYTILIYGNHEWSYDWRGETLFFNDQLSEVVYTSMIKPGRVVVFDSRIPHTATPPSLISPYPRYTYAIKAQLLNSNENTI